MTDADERSLRVVVADDHPLYREGLATVLGLLDGIEVVGQGEDGAQAVELVRRLAPDVCLMDLHMPILGGIEATREIVQAGLPASVLVLTMLEDDRSLFAAMRAGARGYLVKGAARAEVERAIHAVARGELIFSPAVASSVLAFFAGDPVGAGADPRPFPDLTDREREVLDLLARGLTNQTIASRLHIAPKTVRNQVSSIFTKLSVHDRSAAVVRAREVGFGGAGG